MQILASFSCKDGLKNAYVSCRLVDLALETRSAVVGLTFKKLQLWDSGYYAISNILLATLNMAIPNLRPLSIVGEFV